MEHPSPESGPVLTGPDIKALIVAQRIHNPSRKRQPIGDVQVASEVLLNVSDDLSCLIVNRSEGRFPTKEKAIDSGRNNMEVVFQDINQRQEYLMRHPQPWNQKQTGIPFISASVESYFFKVIKRPVRSLYSRYSSPKSASRRFSSEQT